MSRQRWRYRNTMRTAHRIKGSGMHKDEEEASTMSGCEDEKSDEVDAPSAMIFNRLGVTAALSDA